MIKATIQNSPYCTEIRFPCSETELSKKLGEIKMNPENLALMATVIEIEPAELSMLTDCDVSLDALNYLGKRLDGMDESEHKQYLAVLSCPEISEGWADEDLGVNVGMAEFENGEVTFDEFYNAHSRDAYELAADLWGLDLAEEGYVFNEETRSYDYRPDEQDESPKME